ncbi:MAG TPA: DUF5011 domain-containing protein [Candidatus Streptococcus faecavium]|uniref:DUF5011 domain-containing protein n=1 Tax=Candidatus Streptococcus faecavium TaxID=2838763 RepID=A0A9D2FU20_9STRE|nr:DUF5011 domain-containing protein [Candidatus Streptococcus faecavium]
MKKIKPILICGGLLLSAGLALSACHTPEQQSTSASKTSTSKTTEKSVESSKGQKKASPFATLPKSAKKTTTPSIPKENESAMQNFAKATLNRILNGAREEKKSAEGNTSNGLEKAVEAKETPLESVEKPVHLTMADIDTKPVITVKQGKDEPKPIVINQPAIPKDEPSTGPIIIDVPVKPDPEPDVPKVDIPDKEPDISVTVPEPGATEPSQPSEPIEPTEPVEPIEPPIVKTTPILKIQSPVITINEGEAFILENYVELTDVPDAQAKMTPDEFNLEPGEHTITVTATNKFGNTATALLSVIVNAKPQLFLSQDTLEIEKGGTFTPTDYASATDKEDGDITESITVDNPVDTQTPGTYEVIYTVEDTEGATTYATLVVTVKDEPSEPNQPTEPTNPDTPDNPDESGGNNGKDIEDGVSDSEEGTVPDTEGNTDVEKGTTEENVDIHTVVPEA